MAIQSLNADDVNDVSIPLGVNANQGEQLRFSIDHSDLPEAVNVYLEDNVSNTYTLLNTGDYVLTPSTDLSGTGRFYLHFSNTVLSTTDENLNQLSIYTHPSEQRIFIAGELNALTTANLYDIQGRLVRSKVLDTNSRLNQLDVTNISAGIYVVKLNSDNQTKTQKVILR